MKPPIAQLIQGLTLLSLASFILGHDRSVSAQPITAAPDGTNTKIAPNGNRFDISGGQQSGDGANLFHSFQRFGLNEGQIANFLSNPNIRNILGRVTGGEASLINGLIQVTGGNSNLFLMNPAGIIFGTNASLNVPASFTATTASGIGFGSDRFFNAFGNNDWSALVGTPNTFRFDNTLPGVILNAGNLAVATGENLTLLGGITIDTGKLSAPGGSVTLAAVPESTLVRLTRQGHLLNLEFSPLAVSGSTTETTPLQPLSLPQLLTGGTDTHARGIAVNSQGQVVLTASQTVIPTESGTAIASGTIDVSNQLGGAVYILGRKVGAIDTNINASGLYGGGTVLIGGGFQGNGSVPNALQTAVNRNSTINADAIQSGDGGQAIVWSDRTTRFSGQITAKGGATSGNGGFVEISGKENLVFTGNIDVSASAGLLGSILFDPQDITIIAATGTGDDTQLNPSVPTVGDPAGVILQGDGGTLTDFVISDAKLGSLTGDITLQASRDITLTTNLNLPGTAGTTISFTANRNFTGTGFNITAPSRNVQITAQNIGVGDINTSTPTGGGNITLQTTGGGITFGNLLTNATTGNAGAISLTTSNGIIVGGNLTTNATTGNAGPISLTSNNGSINVGNITANATTGSAGQISLTAIAGSITALNLTTNSNINPQDVFLSALDGTVTVNAINAGVNIPNPGNAGNIFVSAGGDIRVTGTLPTSPAGPPISLFTSTFNGVAGTIALTSTGGGINLPVSGEVWSSTNTGQGGNIELSAFGNINLSSLISFSNNGSAGNVIVNSTTGSITTSSVTAGSSIAAYGIGAGNRGGDVTFTAAGDINTAIGNGPINLFGRVGAHDGNLTFISTGGQISTPSINAIGVPNIGTGNLGNITISAASDINIAAINPTLAKSGVAGVVDITSSGGNITAGPVNARNVGAGNGSSITFSAPGNISVSGVNTSSVGGTGGNITFNGNAILSQPDTSIASSGGIGGGSVTFNQLLNGTTAGANNLAIDAGSGNVAFNQAVGSLTPLGNLLVTSTGTTQISGNVTASGGLGQSYSGSVVPIGDVALTSDEIDFGGPVSGTGNLTLQPYTPGTPIALGNPVSSPGVLDLTAAELSQLSNFNSVTIGNTEAGNITIGSDPIDISQLAKVSLVGGTISQTAAIDASTVLTLNASSNDITLADPANDFKTVEVTGNNIALADANAIILGNSNITGNLSIVATGNITQSNAIVISGDAVLTSQTGDITLTDPANNFNSVALTGNQVALQDVDALSFSNGNITGNLNVTAGGNITQTGSIAITETTTLNAGSNDITLTNATNDFNNIAVTGNNVSLQDSNAINVSSGNITGNLNVTAGGNITQTGSIAITETTTLNAGSNDITLTNATNDFNNIAVVGNNVSLQDSNALSFGNTNIDGNLNVTVGGNITQTGAIAIAETTTLNAGSNDITLTNATNDFNNIAVIGNNVSLQDSNALSFSNANITGNLNSTTGGNITQTGSIAITETATLNAGSNDIILTNATNDFNNIAVVGNNVSLQDSNALSFSNANITSNLNVTTGGNITQTGAIAIAETTTLNAGSNDITLTNATNDFNNIAVIGNNVSLQDSNALSFSNANIAGNLNATAGGNITQTGAVAIAETTMLNAGSNDITLTNATNDFNNIAVVGNNVSFQDSNALSFSNANIAGNLNATAGGNITQTGAIGITGNTTLNAGSNDVTLTNTTNNFNSVSITGNNVSLQDSNSIVLNQGNIPGNLSVTAGGNITQTGAIGIAGTTTLKAENNDITLTNPGNDFNSISVTGNNVSLQDSNAIGLGSANIAGNFSVIAGGNITQTNAMAIAGNTSLNAGSNDITLTNPTNALGPLTLTGNNVSLIESTATQIQSANLTGNLNVTSSGSITQEGIVTVANQVNFSSKTDIISNAPINSGSLTLVGGNITLQGAIAATAGNVTLTNSGQLNIGANADITASGSFQQNGTGAVATAGDITSQGITFAQPITLTDATAFSTQGGSITFQNTVDGPSHLTVGAGSGSINFSAPVGQKTPLGNLIVTSGILNIPATAPINLTGNFQQSGSNPVNLAGTIATSGGNLQIGGPLTLLGNASLSTATGNLILNTVNGSSAGSQNLTLSAGTGNVKLNGAVGGSVPLGNLIVTSASAIEIPTGANLNLANTFNPGASAVKLGSQINTGNSLLFEGPVTLIGDAVVKTATGDITFNNSINGSFGLTLSADSGSIAFGQSVGDSAPLGNLSVQSANDFTAKGPIAATQIVATAGSGAIETNQLTTSGGNVALTAKGDVKTGQVTTVGAPIRLISQDGSIVTGDLNSSAATGGEIFVNAKLSITTGAINSSGTTGNGGAVTLDPIGDIQVASINSQGGPSGTGGNIFIESTGGFFRATNSFSAPLSPTGTASISAAGGTGGGTITIRHAGGDGGPPIQPFVIGDGTTNGTAAVITNGQFTLDPQSFPASYSLGTIAIETDDATPVPIATPIASPTPTPVTDSPVTPTPTPVTDSPVTPTPTPVTDSPVIPPLTPITDSPTNSLPTPESDVPTSAPIIEAEASPLSLPTSVSLVTQPSPNPTPIPAVPSPLATSPVPTAVTPTPNPPTSASISASASTPASLSSQTPPTDVVVSPSPPLSEEVSLSLSFPSWVTPAPIASESPSSPRYLSYVQDKKILPLEDPGVASSERILSIDPSLKPSTQASTSQVEEQGDRLNPESLKADDLNGLELKENKETSSVAENRSSLTSPSPSQPPAGSNSSTGNRSTNASTTIGYSGNLNGVFEGDDVGNSVWNIEQLRNQEFEGYLGPKAKAIEPRTTIPSIQQALQAISRYPGKRSALIYVLSRIEQLELILVLPQGKPIRYSIPEAKRSILLPVVEEFRSEITNPLKQNTTTYKPSAQQLYQWIMAPLEADLKRHGIETLLFSLDPGLRSLPIAALQDGQQFLIEKYSFSLIPSFSLTNTDYASVARATLLAMGASQFPNQNPLPAVPTELQAIAATWQGRSFLNEAFTLDNLMLQRSLKRFSVIHLATHAEFNPGTPNYSYIQFWNQQLKLDQMPALQWNNPPVELLVLSACRTALGNNEAELGFAGLAIQSGVKSALASLWRVSDDGTLGLMNEFYMSLKQTTTKSEALQRAQLAMIKGQVKLQGDRLITEYGTFPLPPELTKELSKRNFAHPFYWSSFTLIGSPW